MAALVSINLMPTTSGQAAMAGFSDASGASDQGRVIFHELSTKLQPQILDGSMSGALADKLAIAERVPTLLIGKAAMYSSATAAAAWMVANRLRFQPAHREHDAFMNICAATRGISAFGVETESPEWKDSPSVTAVAQTAGQHGGLTVNTAMAMMTESANVDFKPIEHWWGNLPMPMVTTVLKDKDPYGTLVRILGQAGAPTREQFDAGVSQVIPEITAAIAKTTKTTQ